MRKLAAIVLLTTLVGGVAFGGDGRAPARDYREPSLGVLFEKALRFFSPKRKPRTEKPRALTPSRLPGDEERRLECHCEYKQGEICPIGHPDCTRQCEYVEG